jgi:hypothetical protein
MLSGKQFRLTEETIAIETVGGKRVALHVPAGSVVTIRSGPRPDDSRMVDVSWDGHRIVMFAGDIQKRGKQINQASA